MIMFYGQCNDCGQRWELGIASTCVCKREHTTKDEALDLALEALATEEYKLRQIGQSQVYSGIGFAITAIKQARSALVQEPVCKECNGSGEIETGIGMMACTDCPPAAQPAPAPLGAGEISRLWKRHTNPDGQHHNPYDDDGLGFARAVLAAAQPATEESSAVAAPVQEPAGCLRCATPKKCAAWGCSPNTWPSENTTPPAAQPAPVQEKNNG
jgi:hypothetical protein